VSTAAEPRREVAREVGRRGADIRLREVIGLALGLFVGIVSTYAASARSQGESDAKMLGLQKQLESTTSDIRQSGQNYANLLSVVQGQAITVATLTVQVSTLTQQLAAMMQQRTTK
jgi:hypothetical protein